MERIGKTQRAGRQMPSHSFIRGAGYGT
jgi:hypothetical protein